MVWLPILVGVYVTVQVFDAGLPLAGTGSVHVACGEKLPLPVGLTLQVTVPIGVMWPLPLSVTVTVHVTAVPTRTGFGVQVTAAFYPLQYAAERVAAWARRVLAR